MIDRSYYRDFKPAYNAGERFALPAGIYEGYVIAAKVDDTGKAPVLLIQVEIEKGDFAGFYHKQYESQKGGQYGAKYKGVYRITLPDGQDPERDQWRQQGLETLAWVLEDGNPGYHWDFDENKLRGLKVGLNVRERDYYYNGKSGTTTEIGRLESVAKINDPDPNKRPKLMKKRELSEKEKKELAAAQPYNYPQTSTADYQEVDSEELPF